MVAESDVVSADDKRKYMDPDVFILPGTSAAVTFTVGMLAGSERYEFNLITNAYDDFGAGPLGRFEGDMADLTWPWSDAL